MGETQGMLIAAVDNVFAARRAATQSSTPGRSVGLQTRWATRAAAGSISIAGRDGDGASLAKTLWHGSIQCYILTPDFVACQSNDADPSRQLEDESYNEIVSETEDETQVPLHLPEPTSDDLFRDIERYVATIKGLSCEGFG